jgi:hypothetical protein
LAKQEDLAKKSLPGLFACRALHRKIIRYAVLLRGFWLSTHDDGHGDIRNPPPGRAPAGIWTAPEAIRRKPQDQLRGRGLRRPANAGFCGRNLLEFEPEKLEPVFRKDHAQTKG